MNLVLNRSARIYHSLTRGKRVSLLIASSEAAPAAFGHEDTLPGVEVSTIRVLSEANGARLASNIEAKALLSSAKLASNGKANALLSSSKTASLCKANTHGEAKLALPMAKRIAF